MPAAERYFFLHLQKTAGTALYQRLRGHFGPEAVYPTPDVQDDIRSVIDLEFLRDYFATHGDTIRVVTGHFPLCTVDLLGVPFTTFTVLREPVERTLSVLRRRKAAEPRFRDDDLDAIYRDDEVHRVVRNHMVKMLSLSPEEATATPLLAAVQFDDARLARAERNLADRVAVFGLQENFDDFCAELTTRLGWNLGPPRFANRTEARPVPDDLRHAIADDNASDGALYEFAVQLWRERRTGPAVLS